jgi:hypothetical protein
MALFPEYREEHSIYRYTDPVGFADGTLEFIGTVLGRLEPIAASEAMRNGQAYQNCTHYDFLDMEYAGVVLPKDYVIDPRGKQYQVVGAPEEWRNLIPQIVLNLEIPQTEIDISIFSPEEPIEEPIEEPPVEEEPSGP